MDRIQDYILDTEGPEDVKDAVAEPKKKPEVSYEIIAKTNSDVVIRRKTKRTESILAIIPSKGQYYITVDGGEAEKLTSEKMAKFFRQMDEPLEVNLEWLKHIEKGKSFAELVLSFIARYRTAICAGLVDDRYFSSHAWYNTPDIVTIYESAPKLALFLKDKKNSVEQRSPICMSRYREYQPFACGAFENGGLKYLYLMTLIFGLDKTKLYVEKMIERDLNFGCALNYFSNLMVELYQNDNLYVYDWKDIKAEKAAYEKLAKNRNDEHLNADSFINYLLTFQSEGYQDLIGFIGTLRDDWHMQHELYGKIREKYPKNLASHHNRLAQKRAMVTSELDEKAFRRCYEKAVEKEWSNDEYIVKAPANIGEMIDEATQQCNCLRSYIGDVIDGNTSIYFLRKKKHPEDSLITVEVKNDRLVQVKGKFNREPSFEQKQVLEKWVKAKDLSYA